VEDIVNPVYRYLLKAPPWDYNVNIMLLRQSGKLGHFTGNRIGFDTMADVEQSELLVEKFTKLNEEEPYNYCCVNLRRKSY
jgi:hypothetical protein